MKQYITSQTRGNKPDLKRNFTPGTPEKIEGYAVVFNSPSHLLFENNKRFIEVIEPTAFNGLDLENLNITANINHDDKQVLARTKNANSLNLSVDEEGLFYSFTVPDTQLGRDTAENLRTGLLFQSSFKYLVREDDIKWSKNSEGVLVRTISQIADIKDISLVLNAAFENTTAKLSQRDYNAAIKAIKDTKGNDDDGLGKVKLRPNAHVRKLLKEDKLSSRHVISDVIDAVPSHVGELTIIDQDPTNILSIFTKIKTKDGLYSMPYETERLTAEILSELETYQPRNQFNPTSIAVLPKRITATQTFTIEAMKNMSDSMLAEFLAELDKQLDKKVLEVIYKQSEIIAFETPTVSTITNYEQLADLRAASKSNFVENTFLIPTKHFSVLKKALYGNSLSLVDTSTENLYRTLGNENALNNNTFDYYEDAPVICIDPTKVKIIEWDGYDAITLDRFTRASEGVVNLHLHRYTSTVVLPQGIKNTI